MSPPGSARHTPPAPGPRPGQISALLQELFRAPTQPEDGAARTLAPGTRVGRFELVRELGRGSFGVVYEARDPELSRAVALKIIRPRVPAEAAGARLLREAEAAARCAHPNVVTLFDLGRSEHGPYLVLELLRGETLASRLARGPLGVPEALRVAVEVARGLAHAHAQGVIHRDLTPRNTFLCEDGQVKVLDLGLAHAFGHRRVEGGTPGHMAPEQRRGAPEDERTDVYALGVLLHEMLTGQVPAPHGASLEVPALPALGAVVARALEEDPVRRQRDAGELLAALSGLQRELARAAPESGAALALRRRSRRRPLLAAAGALVLLALAGLGAIALLHGRRATPVPPPRVAVLPFRNLSGDPGQDYLGEGIARAIAASLSFLLPVVPGPARSDGPGHADLAAMGRELAVTFVVEGSVQRTEGGLLVRAAAIRTSDSRQLWSDRLDVPAGEVPQLPERVASRVVHGLGLPLVEQSQRGPMAPGTRSAEAYDEYLQGQFASASLPAPAKDEEARVHFARAVELDPGFADALAQLALVELNDYMALRRPDLLQQGEALLARALRLDPRSLSARETHAYLRATRFDFSGAAAEYRGLVADQPLNWRFWDLLCWSLSRTWPRRLAEAEQACLRSSALNPSDGMVYYHLVRVLSLQGKRAEAEQAQRQLEQAYAGTLYVPLGRFLLAMEARRPDEALAAAEEAEAKPGVPRGMMATEQAAALAMAGRLEEALARLSAAVQEGAWDPTALRNDPWYEPLRRDPRFEALLARCGPHP